MSQDDFFGRPLKKENASLEFNLCEICQRRTPTWLEAKFEDETAVVRFTCDDCHDEDFAAKDIVSPDLYAREMEDDEEIEENVRPAWVQEIIDEQSETGSIETIGDTEETQGQPQFSAPEGSFEEETDDVTEEAYEEDIQVQDRQVAQWAPQFIQEALFGPNPAGWLEDRDAFDPDRVDITIKTLGSFVDHDMPSVKLSSIQGLQMAYQKNQGKVNKIKETIKKYLKDEDENVSNFAKEALDQI